MVEQAGVGGEVGARGAADRLLVDLDQPLDTFEAAENPTLSRGGGALLERGFCIRIIFDRNRGAERTGNQLDQRLVTRLDFPEPEIPVTAVITPSGIAQSIRFRLLRETPSSRSQPEGSRLRHGVPPPASNRWRLVSDFATLRRPSIGPL